MIPSTPISCQAVRKMEKSYKTSPIVYKLSWIFYSLHRLAAQYSINNYINYGLRCTIADQKKRKAKCRNLNLCSKEARMLEFWSPKTVLAANQYQAAKDTEI
jgi:hypothetical protein